MPATFRVRAVEAVPERRQYILRGEAIEGKVHAGMALSIPLNSSLSVTVTLTCVGVTSAGDHSESELIVQCDSPGELDVLLALKVGEGKTLEVTESPEPQA